MSRIYLRAPTIDDEAAFLSAARHSRAIHRPWVKAPTSETAYRVYLANMAEPANVALLVCLRRSDALVGVFNITNIVRGLFRSAYLGYYVFAGYERRGLMRAGLEAVVRHAFGRLKLHRLEANIQPANAASIALVKACGFAREGYSPRYLKIGGRWRDHERWARLAR